MTEHKADALILFGITGDLARRRLIPALYRLVESGEKAIPIIGVGRTETNDSELRQRVELALADADFPVDRAVLNRLVSALTYVQGDYADPALYQELKAQAGEKSCTAAYLAIPPDVFDAVIQGLAEAGLSRRGRVIVEKPFGRDTASGHELNRIIHRHYPEERVYRIDHFLGKEAMQNLMVYRFSNTMLEPIWNRHFVRGVQITLAESYGVEGRGSFYDTVGAMRDVVQNHLLVLISLLAMEPPVSDAPDALRDERVKVLQAMKPLQVTDVIRGQYEGYREEPGVAGDSESETFFAARFEIDSWRWAGVPWVVRAGKGMSTTVTEAVVEFFRPPRLLFADETASPGPNRVYFRSKPQDRITLSMQAKRPGPKMVSESVDLELDYEEDAGHTLDAYQRLLGDALRGDASLFARVDSVMEAWRVVQPALDSPPPVIPYARDSWGPKEADSLLEPEWDWLTD